MSIGSTPAFLHTRSTMCDGYSLRMRCILPDVAPTRATVGTPTVSSKARESTVGVPTVAHRSGFRGNGADRDRTGNPCLAKAVLSQLSYGPGTRSHRSPRRG